MSEHATAIADEHEVVGLLSEAARGGSVAAMKELRAYHRERQFLGGGVALAANSSNGEHCPEARAMSFNDRLTDNPSI